MKEVLVIINYKGAIPNNVYLVIKYINSYNN